MNYLQGDGQNNSEGNGKETNGMTGNVRVESSIVAVKDDEESSTESESTKKGFNAIDLQRSSNIMDVDPENEDVDDDLYGFDDDSEMFQFEWKLENYLQAEAKAKIGNGSVDRIRSPIFNHPNGDQWRLLVFPAGNQTDCLSVYLECATFADDQYSMNDAVHQDVGVSFVLKLINSKDSKQSKTNNTEHDFNRKHLDFGFKEFVKLADVKDPSVGYLKDGALTFQVCISPTKEYRMRYYDSKKRTGMVGLRNLGATCYLNSLLQTLFHTRDFRRSVYKLDTSDDKESAGVVLEMQRLFWNLQNETVAIGTRPLTVAFGWKNFQCFTQHDVQELNRELCDKLDERMKGTIVEGTVGRLFKGKYKSFIRCTQVDYESSRVEDYYDIQLDIKGLQNVNESFKEYVKMERLDGENQYDANKFGKQDADKGVRFLSFPPVLHLHLKRFMYDMHMDCTVKVNDRYEFPTTLNLTSYLHEDVKPETPEQYEYELHSVLVHSGDMHCGHYYAFVCLDDVWYKFDDETVTKVSKHVAVDNTFGGYSKSKMINCSNAYMLVYIQKSQMKTLMKPIPVEDVPKRLVDRFHKEKEEQAQREREAREEYLYQRIFVARDKDVAEFFEYKVNRKGRYRDQDSIDDFVDFDNCEEIKVEKSMQVSQLYPYLKEMLKVQNFRLWWCSTRENHSTRPDELIGLKDEATINDVLKDLEDVRAYIWLEEMKDDEPFLPESKFSQIQTPKGTTETEMEVDSVPPPVEPTNNVSENTTVPIPTGNTPDNETKSLEQTTAASNTKSANEEESKSDAEVVQNSTENSICTPIPPGTIGPQVNPNMNQMDDDDLESNLPILIFIRMYDPNEKEESKKLKHVGHVFVQSNQPIETIQNDIIKMANGDYKEDELEIFEMVTPAKMSRVEKHKTFSDARLQNGDILCVQRKSQRIMDKFTERFELAKRFSGLGPEVEQRLQFLYYWPGVKDWVSYFIRRKEVRFVAMEDPNAEAITLELRTDMTIQDVRSVLSRYLPLLPNGKHVLGKKIQICNAFDQDTPVQSFKKMLSIPFDVDETVPQIAYRVLPFSVEQLTSKKYVEIPVLTNPDDFQAQNEKGAAMFGDKGTAKEDKGGFDEQKYVKTVKILVPNNANIQYVTELVSKELLRSDIQFPYTIPDYAIRLHLVKYGKYIKILSEEEGIFELPNALVNNQDGEKSSVTAEIYRVATPAENPISESVLVTHICSKTYSASPVVFGVPFMMHVSNNETFASLLYRIKERLGVDEKQFLKWRPALYDNTRKGNLRFIDETPKIDNQENPTKKRKIDPTVDKAPQVNGEEEEQNAKGKDALDMLVQTEHYYEQRAFDALQEVFLRDEDSAVDTFFGLKHVNVVSRTTVQPSIRGLHGSLTIRST